MNIQANLTIEQSWVDIVLQRAETFSNNTAFHFLPDGKPQASSVQISFASLVRRAKAIGCALVEQGATGSRIPVIADIISNIIGNERVVRHHDIFLQHKRKWKTLIPELIITFGKSLVSKNLKIFLRKSGSEHWHISQTQAFQDPFQSLTRSICCEPVRFLTELNRTKPKNREFLI